MKKMEVQRILIIKCPERELTLHSGRFSRIAGRY